MLPEERRGGQATSRPTTADSPAAKANLRGLKRGRASGCLRCACGIRPVVSFIGWTECPFLFCAPQSACVVCGGRVREAYGGGHGGRGGGQSGWPTEYVIISQRVERSNYEVRGSRTCSRGVGMMDRAVAGGSPESRCRLGGKLGCASQGDEMKTSGRVGRSLGRVRPGTPSAALRPPSARLGPSSNLLLELTKSLLRGNLFQGRNNGKASIVPPPQCRGLVCFVRVLAV